MKNAGLKNPEFKEIDNKVYLVLKHESAQSKELSNLWEICQE
jgi:hypothetical protein